MPWKGCVPLDWPFIDMLSLVLSYVLVYVRVSDFPDFVYLFICIFGNMVFLHIAISSCIRVLYSKVYVVVSCFTKEICVRTENNSL